MYLCWPALGPSPPQWGPTKIPSSQGSFFVFFFVKGVFRLPCAGALTTSLGTYPASILTRQAFQLSLNFKGLLQPSCARATS